LLHETEKCGKLVEEGTYKQLMEQNGTYANLYSKQFKAEK